MFFLTLSSSGLGTTLAGPGQSLLPHTKFVWFSTSLKLDAKFLISCGLRTSDDIEFPIIWSFVFKRKI